MGNEVYFHSSLGLVEVIDQAGEYYHVEVVFPGLYAGDYLIGETPLSYEAHGVDQEMTHQVRLTNRTWVHSSEVLLWEELLSQAKENPGPPEEFFIPREFPGEPGEADPRVTDIYEIIGFLGREQLFALCQGVDSGEVRIFPVWDLVNVQTGEGLFITLAVSDELTVQDKVLKRLVRTGAEHWKKPWKSLKHFDLRAVAKVKVHPGIHGLVLLEGDGSLQEIPWVYYKPGEIELQGELEEEVVATIKRFLDYVIQERRRLLRQALGI